MMTAEAIPLNGNTVITGDLLVPGMPTVRVNGHPSFSGTIDGSGNSVPANYQLTLNGNVTLRHVIRRTDPLTLPAVNAVSQPTGTRNVALNDVGQNPGDFVTLHNLTLNGNVGQIAVPPGSYGDFTANSNSGFTLGIAGAAQPAIYSLQRLTLNGNTTLRVIGPAILTVANSVTVNGAMGAAGNPLWLTLKLPTGGLTLNGNVSLYGCVQAPNGTVILNGNSQLVGGLACDRLTINGNSLLGLVAINQPPGIALASPVQGTSVIVSTPIVFSATATDPDGTIALVEFYNGVTRLGIGVPVAGQPAIFNFTLPSGLPVGSYTFTALATDNTGATTISTPVSITVALAPNTAPQVVLTSPAAHAALIPNTAVTLKATATDVDGTISKVEFYDGAAKLGEAAPVPGDFSAFTLPFTFTAVGAHTLFARATDNIGAFADSAPIVVTVLAVLPYTTDFETGEGYGSGSLSGQLGWSVNRGAGEVTNQDSAYGAQSVVLLPGVPSAQIEQDFAPSAGADVVFVDFFTKPAAAIDLTSADSFNVESSLFGFVLNGRNGDLQVFNGDGFGGGQWGLTSFMAPLSDSNQAQNWMRLTARLDFARKTWDLYANESMVAADLGFRDNTRLHLSSFLVQGNAIAATLIDDIFAGPQNPLFADVNNNGLDDTWETAHGLSLTANNRHASPTGNGVTVVQAYITGTDPNDYYNGVLPVITSLVADNGQPGPDGLVAVRVTKSDGTLLPNAPLTFALTSDSSQISSVPGGASADTTCSLHRCAGCRQSVPEF